MADAVSPNPSAGPTPEPHNCAYRFRHPDRPRDQCGLPVIGGSPSEPPLCVWHNAESRPKSFDLGAELVKEVSRPGHWLEGAQLAQENLRDLYLFEAKLPDAGLELADMSGAFLARACLEGANLGSAILTSAKLNCASLVGTVLDKANAEQVNLEGADLSGARLHGARFDGAYLHGAKLSPETVSYDANLELPGELLDCQYLKAAHVFRSLGSHFHSVSNHHQSVEFYFREMTALHLAAINATCLPAGSRFERAECWISALKEHGDVLTWMGWAIHRWLWGYGVRPNWTISWILAVILLFGLLVFPIVGVVPPSRTPFLRSTSNGSVPQRAAEVRHDPLNGLALSIVTYGTLGYGNRTPQGLLGEIFAGVEACLGALLTSIFIVSLATRYVHRA
jgi:hypothetical protein